MKKLSQWIQAHRSQKIVKFIVGIRGMEKSQVLRKCLPNDVVRIDFDDPKWRRLKTAADVIAYLNGRGTRPACPDSPTACPLILEEPGRIFGHTMLLRTLVESGKWNVFVVASNRHVIEDMREYWPEGQLAQFRIWRRVGRPRSEEYLFAVWNTIFVRDVADGIEGCDVRRFAALAEYYSDHIGAVVSNRRIAKVLVTRGRKRCDRTVGLMRKALEKAYIIEFCECYDAFEDVVIKNMPKVFWTDLEIRDFRFGSAPDEEDRRHALNRLYLDLRYKYERVYWPRDHKEADFLTIDAKGKHELWSVKAKAQ